MNNFDQIETYNICKKCQDECCESIVSTCAYCGEKYDDDGSWQNLCDRRCYYGLTNLLEAYNKSNGDVQPDPRLVAYFTLNSDVTHSFCDDKIKLFIKKSDQKILCVGQKTVRKNFIYITCNLCEFENKYKKTLT